CALTGREVFLFHRSIHGLFTPPLWLRPPQRPPPAVTLTLDAFLLPSAPPPAKSAAVRCSAVHACVGTHERDFGWDWTGVSGWGRVAPQGTLGGRWGPRIRRLNRKRTVFPSQPIAEIIHAYQASNLRPTRSCSKRRRTGRLHWRRPAGHEPLRRSGGKG